MGVHWLQSVDKHGIDRDEVMFAMSHADTIVAWPPARSGRTVVPTLFVGPSRFGTLEVLAEVSRGEVVIFHAMRLRVSTQAQLAQLEG